MSIKTFLYITFFSLFFFSFGKTNKTKNVQAIIKYIDKLYDIKTPEKVDSITEFSKVKPENYPSGLFMYAKTDIKKYYRYISFRFFIFNDNQKAKVWFKELLRISQTKEKYDTTDGKQYMALFLKSGSTYILHNNMIIHHIRSCSYNDKIEKPREAKLVNYLYDDQLPADRHFVRITCGWGNPEIK